MSKYINKWDILLTAALLTVCLLVFALTLLPTGSAHSAVVSVDGAEVGRLPLETDGCYTFRANEHTNIIEVSSGRVRMLRADCTDGLCVGQGWISKPGQVIVCLPAHMTISLIGGETEVDAVVR